MKNTLIAIALLLVVAGAFAQEAKKSEPQPQPELVSSKQLRSRIFEIQNRNPEEIASAIRLLGSGAGMTAVSVNSQLNTITVRDFPENIAVMEEAIKRLDRPAPAAPNIDLRIAILIGSKTPLPKSDPMPDDLAPVLKELRATLQYPHYVLVASNVTHPKAGVGSEFQTGGVADAAALALGIKEHTPVEYNTAMRHVNLTTAGDRQALTGDFQFFIRFPFVIGDKTTWQTAKIDTPVTVRDGEHVVVGTTSVGDSAAIVVMFAKFAAEK